MKLTVEQQRIVNENMGLVGKVISDKIHGLDECSIYSYDDIYQIGCIGLCKAAVTDTGGCFSTYAYRLIWNEICDALIYATRRQIREKLSDDRPVQYADRKTDEIELKLDIQTALQTAKSKANPTVCKGIDALVMHSRGLNSREIGEKMNAAPNLVTAWISKARKYLKECPEVLALLSVGGTYEKI